MQFGLIYVPSKETLTIFGKNIYYPKKYATFNPIICSSGKPAQSTYLNKHFFFVFVVQKNWKVTTRFLS